MNAFEFVKEKGIERAKREVKLIGTIAVITCDEVWLAELKRIVESHELVGAYGGLDGAKKKLSKLCILRWIAPEITELGQAISDVEACS